MNTLLTAQMNCAGRYRFETAKVDGNGHPLEHTRRVAVDWFDNLVMNDGLNRMLTRSDWLDACYVGTGSEAPTPNDSRLGKKIAKTETVLERTSATVPDQHYGYVRITYRFPAGFHGDLTEVGIGNRFEDDGSLEKDDPGYWDQYALFSRALIRDANGQPTTLTKLDDEILDVVYEFRLYAPTEDGSGDVVLGNANTKHHWTCRALCLGDHSTAWDNRLGQPFNCLIGPAPFWGGRVSARNTLYGLLDNPDFSTSPLVTKAECHPHPSSGEGDPTAVDITVICDMDNGNFSEGIGWIGVSGTFGAFQWVFEPRIPKNADRKLELSLHLQFGRQ